VPPDRASAYALAGETDRAAAELAAARRRAADDRYSSLPPIRAVGALVPKVFALFGATYGLRKASMRGVITPRWKLSPLAVRCLLTGSAVGSFWNGSNPNYLI